MQELKSPNGVSLARSRDQFAKLNFYNNNFKMIRPCNCRQSFPEHGKLSMLTNHRLQHLQVQRTVFSTSYIIIKETLFTCSKTILSMQIHVSSFHIYTLQAPQCRWKNRTENLVAQTIQLKVK